MSLPLHVLEAFGETNDFEDTVPIDQKMPWFKISVNVACFVQLFDGSKHLDEQLGLNLH